MLCGHSASTPGGVEAPLAHPYVSSNRPLPARPARPPACLPACVQYWCCAAEGGGETSIFLYELPPPYAAEGLSGWQPWQPPVLQRPAYCDRTDLTPSEVETVAYANHPCQFLTNSTAAAIAAAIS